MTINMKKILILLAAALLCMQASAQSIRMNQIRDWSDSVNAVISRSVLPNNCPVTFGDIEGDALDNNSIVSALQSYQPILPTQQLLDTKQYYLDGHQSLSNFADAARLSLNVRLYDSTGMFVFFNDSTNAFLTKGSIANADSNKMFAGFYRYGPSTTGWKPSGGTGFVQVMVAQDNGYYHGAGRVYYSYFDNVLHTIGLRFKLDATTESQDTVVTFALYRSLLSPSSLFVPITGGAMLGNSAFLQFPKRITGIPYPTDAGVQIGTSNDGRLYWADSTNGGSSLRHDFKGVNGDKVITWSDNSGTVPLIDGSGHLDLWQGQFRVFNGSTGNGVIISAGSADAFAEKVEIDDAAGIRLKYGNTDVGGGITRNSGNNVGELRIFSDSTINNAFITFFTKAHENARFDSSGRFYLKRLQNVSKPYLLNYDNTTNEVTFSASTTGNVIGTVFTGSWNASTLTSGQTQYLLISGRANPGTQNVNTSLIGEAGTLTNFAVLLTGTQDASGGMTITVLKNGVATALTITIAAGTAAGTSTVYSDVAHSVSISQFDQITIKAVNSATGTSAGFLSGTLTLKQ